MINNNLHVVGAGAFFNPEKTHRYYLWRIWASDLPLVAFIGLNPSKANESKNDNTISKVIKVAKNNGFGGLYMLNLFAFVSPYPEDLLIAKDPLGDNDKWINNIYLRCKEVVFCWGNFKQSEGRAKQVIEMCPAALCLDQNKNGSPKHPLYCSDNTILKPFILP